MLASASSFPVLDVVEDVKLLTVHVEHGWTECELVEVDLGTGRVVRRKDVANRGAIATMVTASRNSPTRSLRIDATGACRESLPHSRRHDAAWWNVPRCAGDTYRDHRLASAGDPAPQANSPPLPTAPIFLSTTYALAPTH